MKIREITKEEAFSTQAVLDLVKNEAGVLCSETWRNAENGVVCYIWGDKRGGFFLQEMDCSQRPSYRKDTPVTADTAWFTDEKWFFIEHDGCVHRDAGFSMAASALASGERVTRAAFPEGTFFCSSKHVLAQSDVNQNFPEIIVQVETRSENDWCYRVLGPMSLSMADINAEDWMVLV